MSGYDLIPAAMLVVGLVAAGATLIDRQKVAGRAVIALFALFVLGLFFQAPTPPELAHLHPFPVVLLALILTVPPIMAAAVLGWAVRGVLRIRRNFARGRGAPPG